MKKHTLLFLFLSITVPAWAQQAMPTLETFGKNRIQHQAFEWKVLTTANFEIYFHQDGQATATMAVGTAEAAFENMTDVLGYTPSDRTKIFIYNSVRDLNQSNMGLGTQEGDNPQEINLQNSRIELAYAGNQADFRKQLLHGIAQVYVYDMLYGGSLRETLQNNLLLNLPDWFMAGITNYLTDGWGVEMDSYMRDAVLNKRMKRPAAASGQEAALMGQSIWNYIAERYGRDNISNILNLTRIIRNEETSIASTLGLSYSRFVRDWRDYYANMATPVADAYKAANPNLKVEGNPIEKGYRLRKVRLSADQQFVAYSSNDFGKYSVEITNTSNKKKTLVLSGGSRNTSYPTNPNLPLVAWQRANNLAVIYEDLSGVMVEVFEVSDKGATKMKTRRALKGLSQVTDFDISEDGTMLVLSADKKGQNDLYLYRINGNAFVQLTNDAADDRYPQFVGRSNSQVVFTSNRTTDTLKVGEKISTKNLRNPFAIFLHDGNPRSQTLTRIIDSVGVMTRPIAANERTFYFLSDERGIQNLYRYEILDSLRTQLSQLTNARYNFLDYDLNTSVGGLAYISLENGQEFVGYQTRINLNQSLNVPPTAQALKNQTMVGQLSKSTEQPKEPTTAVKEVEKPAKNAEVKSALNLQTGEIDTDNYEFDNQVVRTIEPKADKPKSERTVTRQSGLRTAKRDNTKVKGPNDYQDVFMYNGSSGNIVVDPLPQRGLGWKQTLAMNDLLENHLMKASAFITPNFRNSDVSLEYHYLPHRIDYSFQIDRRTIFEENEVTTQKFRFNQIALTASYPVSTTTRFSLTPMYALSRAIDVERLATADKVSDYAGGKVEFVFDNTTTNGMNLMEGTRAKIKYSYYDGLTNKADGFQKVTLDVRNYTKIHKELILATRVSFGRSMGAAPKQFILGGMDNWLFLDRDSRTVNDGLRPADRRDLFFSEFASPLRGFNINKQSGTNFLALNVELRLPLVKYLYRGPITSNFLRNFQLSAFYDVGSAWSESGPFSIRYDYPIPQPSPPASKNPFQAAVNTFKSPFIMGYGVGARTMLFGYYVKSDLAWGIENRSIQSPLLYLTLGYDF